MGVLVMAMAAAWLLALCWLLLIGRQLNRLSAHDAELYGLLGRPVMRWLWWSWPEPRPGPGPYLSLGGLAQGRVELRSTYAPDEIRALWSLLVWIVTNRPRPSPDQGCRRLQRRLRLCGCGFLLAFAAVLVGVVSLS